MHDPDAYGTPPYGQPGPWAPAPPVQRPAMTTPAAGTALPSHGPHDPSAPAAPVPPHDAMAPVTAPVPGTVPAPGPTPAPPAGAQVPGTVPVPPGDAPPATGTALPAPEPVAAVPPGTAPRISGPWQNYDPWAARGPFQRNGAPVAGQERRRMRSRRALVLGAALIALLAGGAGGVVGALLERDAGAGNVQLPQAGAEPARRSPNSIAGIAAHALPGVVTLHVKGADGQGTGTGFVLDGQGHILTNNHVVEAAGPDGRITAAFGSGETATATVVGRDTGYDLAVVKVSGVHGLNPLPLGNSDNVQVGDPVVAIGAPFDLAGTVTSGIISAKERPVTAGGEKGDGSDVSYVDALQTDAPINPGNSGGPLLDARGRVVGINSAIRSADGGSGEGAEPGSIGLGFAIPVNQAKRVAEELINTGRATHPVIGITLDMNYSGDGARVGAKGSVAGGPGDKAGIRPGDVVTAIDGVRVHSGQELIVRTRAHRPGDRLRLRVVRGGAQRTITLVLGSAGGD
ncbi:trypsin-like peptidase domain-containing protein [Streptomyces sp. NPDC047022]|uniref:S1C family serine protease n=1 Tax=Streptomyces sp. NPDC047022 TaxID=3155737 RepID=UPI0033EA0FE7